MTHYPQANVASRCTKRPTRRSVVCASLCTLSVLLGAGCSSGSGGDDDAMPDDPLTADPVVATTSSEVLRRNAADTFGVSIDNSLTGFQTLDDAGDTTTMINDDGRDLLATSLGLEAGSTAEASREEERITVDPDEIMLCAELAGDDPQTIEDGLRCIALMSDLTVDLVASGEAAGSITYLFQDTPLFVVGYGNNQDEIKLDLNGLKLFADANDALDPNLDGETRTPETFDGELSISAITTNDAPDDEAGSISIAVSRAIEIVDTNTSFSLQPGELMTISTDSATGNASISYEVGALALTAPRGDSDVLTMAADGFTGSATIAEDGDRITVSNLGIGNGPLQMRVNSVEALTLTMQTFGFSVLADNGVDGSDPDQSAEIVIDGAMDIGLFVSNAFDLDDGITEAFSAMIEASAPFGTIFSSQEIPDEFGFVENALRLDSGGPFIYNISMNEGDSNSSESVTVNAGQCLQSSGAADDDDDAISFVGGEIVEIDSSDEMETLTGLDVVECP